MGARREEETIRGRAPDERATARREAAGPIVAGLFENAVDPSAWLTRTLQRLANGWPNSRIEDLMPWNHAR